ncbi:hypothetical protein M7I_2171 [Glarea lozoyensis 74030]|uniref:Uncharacterized protein n=1 Tax=Glarea lozoyensis (strain ATCC 74030 / MF5533) TaxID=1104152 RepID=H0EI25_GLAL7|nr:hypothetical protein M7I_2171 [Glarea lozoyensis 74030]
MRYFDQKSLEIARPETVVDPSCDSTSSSSTTYRGNITNKTRAKQTTAYRRRAAKRQSILNRISIHLGKIAAEMDQRRHIREILDETREEEGQHGSASKQSRHQDDAEAGYLLRPSKWHATSSYAHPSTPSAQTIHSTTDTTGITADAGYCDEEYKPCSGS